MAGGVECAPNGHFEIGAILRWSKRAPFVLKTVGNQIWSNFGEKFQSGHRRTNLLPFLAQIDFFRIENFELFQFV